MFGKLANLSKRAYYALAFGVPVALTSAVAFAEGEAANGVTPEIPSELSGLNLTSVITSLAGKIGPALAAGLGLVIGIWCILLIWRKVRSAMY